MQGWESKDTIKGHKGSIETNYWSWDLGAGWLKKLSSTNGFAGIQKKACLLGSMLRVSTLLGLEIHLPLILALQMLKPHFYINFES